MYYVKRFTAFNAVTVDNSKLPGMYYNWFPRKMQQFNVIAIQAIIMIKNLDLSVLEQMSSNKVDCVLMKII